MNVNTKKAIARAARQRAHNAEYRAMQAAGAGNMKAARSHTITARVLFDAAREARKAVRA